MTYLKKESVRLKNSVVNGILIRWINKYNPEIARGKWSDEENRRLFGLYRIKQNRWKEISMELVSRSDNAAKNQFFAMIRKGLRKACRSIGMVNNTAKVNMIKPKVLLDFYESTYNIECNNYVRIINISQLIEFYSLTDRPSCSLYDVHKKEIINQLIQHLVKNK